MIPIKKMKLLSSMLLILALSGCASIDILTLGLSGISYAVSGKSLSDHVVSTLLDEDCALYRVVVGENICRNGIVSDRLLANDIETNDYLLDRKIIMAPVDISNVITKVDISDVVLMPLEYETKIISEENTYVVIGSFNDVDFAQERKNNFSHLNAQIIRNPIHDVTRYRVVVGPFNYIENEEDLNLLPELEKYTPWRLSLCKKSLSLPPCQYDSLTNISHSSREST